MWKNTFFLLLCCSASLANGTKITRYVPPNRHLQEQESTDGWVSPFEIVDHLHTLSRVTGTMSPRNLPGYSHAIARKFHRHLSTNAPELMEHLVNLGEHYRGSNIQRKLVGSEMIPDVAGQRKRSWERAMEQQQSLRFLAATTIDTCPAEPECKHDPCVKEYLEDPFKPFRPKYGGGGGYTAWMASIKDSQNTKYKLWDGKIDSHTDTDGISVNLMALRVAVLAKEIAGAICDSIDDSIPLCIFCFIIEIPNPAKFICQIFKSFLDIAALILDTFKNQVDYQDARVTGAEIEAAYEHTRNLLHKQCAIYDEVVCRCVENSNGYGLGCDGLDSNCDDDVDDCDEDKVAPTIDLGKVLQRCGGYFKTLAEAEECVLNSVVATDDCYGVNVTVTSQGTCDSAYVTITATETICGKSTTVNVPVFVDGTAPITHCSFAPMDALASGSAIAKDVNFSYSAIDACQKPMQVTVDVYSSEMDVLNPENMAVFFSTGNVNNAAKLYLKNAICEQQSTGVTIKDPAAKDARLYTVTVSATDVAGNYGKSHCQLRIIPVGNLVGKLVDTTNSTQRLHVASYTSLWSVY